MVGRARMAQPTSGMSQPSVRHHAIGDDLGLARLASRARMASRSSFGVSPSRCSARTPERTNSSRKCRLCATLTAKATVLPALAELVPVGDDVADQLGNVHAIGELLLDVVTGPACARRADSGSTGA